ncbi:MAG: tetratricopeptide repeat protein [Thermoguttaceae bacterium]
MSKAPQTPGEEDFDEPSFLLRPPSRWRLRAWLRPALITGTAAVVCMAICHKFLPDELGLILYLLVGPAVTALVVWVFAWSTRQSETTEEWVHRVRKGQHSDFGKRLRQAHAKRLTVDLPGLGETSIRRVVATILSLVMICWWFGPFGPVDVRQPEPVDLIGPLAEQIVAVALVMPNTSVATLQRPIPSPGVRQLAWQIGDDANEYYRGVRAIARGRFDEARTLLAEAMGKDAAKPVQIRIARAMNEMYAGRFLDAVQWYDGALQSRPEDPELLCQMAVAWMLLYQFDKAEPLLAQAEAACQAAESEGPNPVLGICRHLQAIPCIGRGRGYEEAESRCVQAREIFEETYGEQHPLTAVSLNNHAILYLLQAKYPGAEGLVQRAHNIWTRSFGQNDPRLLASLTNLAMLYTTRGQYEKAGQRIDEALAIRPVSLPEKHPATAIVRNAAAVYRRAIGDYREAQALANDEALAVCEEALGSEHPNVAAILDTLATIHADRSLHTMAERYYLRAATITEEVWGPNHPYLAAVRNHTARLFVGDARVEEAEPLCRQALETLRHVFGEKHPSVAAVLETYGDLEVRRGQSRQAREYFTKALTIREEALGKEHPDVARTLGKLGSLNSGPSTYGKGITQYARAIEIADKALGLEHPEVAQLLYGMAGTYFQRKMYTEAEPLLKRALMIREKKLETFHPALADTLEAQVRLLSAVDPADEERIEEIRKRAAAVREAHLERDQAD